MALILRNGGSQSPDRWLKEPRNNHAAKTIKEIYGKFENLQMFPGMGSDLSKRDVYKRQLYSIDNWSRKNDSI